MEMEWIKMSLSPVRELIAFLHRKSKTTDVVKKQLFIELRNNLNVFSNGYRNDAPYDAMIELLRNDAYQQAVKENFAFRKLAAGKIKAQHIRDERNRKYIGWDADKLMDKIDEKITELKTIRQLSRGTVKNARNNIPLMMSNLYFRMKLMADFIQFHH